MKTFDVVNINETMSARGKAAECLYGKGSFLIGSWVSFYPFEKDSFEYQLDQMASAGINFNHFPKHFGWGEYDNPEYWNEIEEQYKKRNMFYHMYAPDSQNPTVIAGLTAIASSGKDHCIGYHVTDEPLAEQLDGVGAAVRAYRLADNQRFPLVNLLPSYAGEGALGGTYRDYLQRYIDVAGKDNVEYLSHDFYFISKNGTGGTKLLFQDMEAMRSVAYTNGRLKTHAFPQSTEWNGMRMPTADEMRWNLYAYLTYGFKALSWFNLVCPGASDSDGEGFTNSMIYRDGTIRDPELFAAFSDLNWEVRVLGDMLVTLDTVHAYHTDEDQPGVEHLPEDFILRPNGTNKFVVSCMEHKENGDVYLMIFNKAFEAVNRAVFTVGSDLKGMEYVNPHTGENEPIDLSEGTLTSDFLAGEGKLYKLIRK